MQNSLAFLSVGGGNLRIYAAYEASLVYFKLKIILRKSRLYLFDFSDKNGFTKKYAIRHREKRPYSEKLCKYTEIQLCLFVLQHFLLSLSSFFVSLSLLHNSDLSNFIY